jgi:hypothetical protein
MKRPPPLTMLLGHPFMAWPVWGGIIITGYRTWNGLQDATGLIVFLVIGALCGKASQARDAYLGWKHDWEAMNGTTPQQRSQATFLRTVTLILVWSFFAFVASALMYRDDDRWMAILFWLCSLAYAVVRIAKWRRVRHSRTRPTKQIAVAVVVRKPAQSATIAQAYAALPDYCRQLFEAR